MLRDLLIIGVSTAFAVAACCLAVVIYKLLYFVVFVLINNVVQTWHNARYYASKDHADWQALLRTRAKPAVMTSTESIALGMDDRNEGVGHLLQVAGSVPVELASKDADVAYKVPNQPTVSPPTPSVRRRGSGFTTGSP